MTRNQVAIGVGVRSKKGVLEQLAVLLAIGEELPVSGEIFDELIARERLGSTGLGNGVAIPHCRVAELREPSAALLTTREAIDFDAMDKAPVNVFFALAVPAESTQDHLQLLAEVASMCNNANLLNTLRSETDPDALLAALWAWTPSE